MSTQHPEAVLRDGVYYHEFDIVIVGAGGAGMRAAIEAGPGARTAVITKLRRTVTTSTATTKQKTRHP